MPIEAAFLKAECCLYHILMTIVLLVLEVSYIFTAWYWLVTRSRNDIIFPNQVPELNADWQRFARPNTNVRMGSHERS